MPLSLVELEILAGLLEGETLAAIGERLGLGHPATSRGLQALQRRTHLTLAEQRGRRLHLTSAGLHAAARARALLEEHRRLDGALEAWRRGIGGPVRIATSPTPGEYLLRGIVSEFTQAFPDADVRLNVVPATDVWQVVRAQDCDLGVGLPPMGEGWLIDRLYEDKHVLCVVPGSPLVRKECLSWDEIRGETFIGAFRQLEWDPLWGRGTHDRFRDVRRIDLLSIEGIKRLAEAGGGIGVVFHTAVRRELETGRLIALNVSDQSCSHEFVALRRAGANALPIVNQFRNYVVGRLARQGFG
jgi:DNA-binding transcriptional LysR family regulator